MLPTVWELHPGLSSSAPASSASHAIFRPCFPRIRFLETRRPCCWGSRTPYAPPSSASSSILTDILTDILIPLNSASNFRLPTSTSTQPTTSPPRHTRKMATMQLQKTRMAQTKTKTVMTQKQSLEVVQTLLHGGVSCAGPMQTACFPQSSEC